MLRANSPADGKIHTTKEMKPMNAANAIRHASRAAALAAAFFCAAALRAAPAFPPTAGGETTSTTPNSITDYERRVLRLEYTRLMKAISAARREALRSEALAPLREASDKARESGDKAAFVASRRALHQAADEEIRKDPEMAAKIKRLGEVGALLEKDRPDRKELRSLERKHRRAPASAPAEDTPANPEAPAGR